MKHYTLQITLYDAAFFAVLFIGLSFALQLWFSKRKNRSANRYLALALGVMVLWIARQLAIDLQLKASLQFSLAFGPLIFFYVLKLTRPDYKFQLKDLLHFAPVLAEQFLPSDRVLQILAFISVVIYLYLSLRLIQHFYQRLKFIGGDRYRFELRWLHRLLMAFSLLCLLWIPFRIFWGSEYPMYLALGGVMIWLAAVAHLRPEAVFTSVPVPKPILPAELRQKAAWLKGMVKTKLYYQDPELSLGSLAVKLGLTTHELSRIINTALKKSFNDFINEYRVAEVFRKMQDPAYHHLTLMGIAYESGFNSKTTFNRAFKQVTGKNPVDYKNIKKGAPSYNSGLPPRFAPIISFCETTPKWSLEKLNRNIMFENYLKIAWRRLFSKKLHSFINIAGLSVGMAVAMLIGLWMYDELSYNKNFDHYNHIAQVMQNQQIEGDIKTQPLVPVPLAGELRGSYGASFQQVVMSTQIQDHGLALGTKLFTKTGSFMEAGAPEMLSLQMVSGTRDGLKAPHSILLSESTAATLFGNTDALSKVLRLDDTTNVQVTGIYRDLPFNSTFGDLNFIAPWDLHAALDGEIKNSLTKWNNNPAQLYVWLKDNADIDQASLTIRNVKAERGNETSAGFRSALFLNPMPKWHLYSEFKNGLNTGGRIQYVWLFGVIGVFILLLACINFMNLSTANSEKRAKEVGVRKAIGSLRSQLITQFFGESIFTALLALILAIGFALIALPYFNGLSDKKMLIPWGEPLFWLLSISFSVITGLIAGSYPAFYLSSFEPVKVLKGTFRAGRFAMVPRQILVVIQFSVSVILIVGTIIVYRQIQFARNRPIGYDRNGLLMVNVSNHGIYDHFEAFRNDLLQTGAVLEAAQSTSHTTEAKNQDASIKWAGKAPGNNTSFVTVGVTPAFGKTVSWQFKDGRDYSSAIPTDKFALVLNETAVKTMGLKDPLNASIQWYGFNFHVIGVIKDMVMSSPFEPVAPTMFFQSPAWLPVIDIKINPKANPADVLNKISAIFKQYDPAEPFNYKFADLEYDAKFRAEQRIGQLTTFFASLAILISCLGLFGVASFVAEQRKKEIGIRKVLGASVFTLWGLLSKEFIILIVISCCIALPVAYSIMHSWLEHYAYHTAISWWIFAVTIFGALIITLLTVSYQTLKAALMTPVKSLRTD